MHEPLLHPETWISVFNLTQRRVWKAWLARALERGPVTGPGRMKEPLVVPDPRWDEGRVLVADAVVDGQYIQVEVTIDGQLREILRYSAAI